MTLITRTGPMNLITDVAGFRVGNATDLRIKTGATVLVADGPFTAGVHVMGGAPGTRETELLAPDKLVGAVDALVLSGGSAFGLDAASGVMDALRAAGRGFEAAGQRVPIVPAAILFDLGNGGDKAWGANPYAALGRAAFEAADARVDEGSFGAGHGATTADLRGGTGTASMQLASGHVVGALVAVNAVGSACIGGGPRFWAAPWEIGDEFGGLGPAMPPPGPPPSKLARPGESTTIAIVATDAVLDKAGCHRMAVAAQDGLARALLPAHTPLDGDLVFAVATGARPLADPVTEALWIGHAAAVCLSRAIARAVYHAAPGGSQPSWGERFGN